MKSAWLMYHEVYAGRTADGIPESAAMYHVPADGFRGHMAAIQASGLRTLTAAEFMNKDADRSALVTFDDGWRGTFEQAVPILHEMGMKATIFITRDFIGGKYFCDRRMIEEAAQAGMEIGVHGTTHRMLSACDTETVTAEFADCKKALEDIIQRPVVSASMPGGDWTRSIAGAVERVGLTNLSTSRPGINMGTTPPFKLRRIAIQRNTNGSDIIRYCRFDVRKESALWTLYRLPKAVLGMRRYGALRRMLLGESRNEENELFKL